MRFVALFVALLVAAAVCYFGYAVAVRMSAGRARRQHSVARWQVRHRGADGQTVVVVVLTTPDGQDLDEHVVARFPDADPEWQSRFLAARQEAEERAFHLNADR